MLFLLVRPTSDYIRLYVAPELKIILTPLVQNEGLHRFKLLQDFYVSKKYILICEESCRSTCFHEILHCQRRVPYLLKGSSLFRKVGYCDSLCHPLRGNTYVNDSEATYSMVSCCFVQCYCSLRSFQYKTNFFTLLSHLVVSNDNKRLRVYFYPLNTSFSN